MAKWDLIQSKTICQFMVVPSNDCNKITTFFTNQHFCVWSSGSQLINTWGTVNGSATAAWDGKDGNYCYWYIVISPYQLFYKRLSTMINHRTGPSIYSWLLNIVSNQQPAAGMWTCPSKSATLHGACRTAAKPHSSESVVSLVLDSSSAGDFKVRRVRDVAGFTFLKCSCCCWYISLLLVCWVWII